MKGFNDEKEDFKIEVGRMYAKANNMKFSLWTEDVLFN